MSGRICCRSASSPARPGSPPRSGGQQPGPGPGSRRPGSRGRPCLAARPARSAGACDGPRRYPRSSAAISYTRGPALSGTRPAGVPSASSTSRAATSPASMGWNRNPAGTGITGSRPICRATIKINSWNGVARSVVHGRPDSSTPRHGGSHGRAILQVTEDGPRTSVDQWLIRRARSYQHPHVRLAFEEAPSDQATELLGCTHDQHHGC